MQNPNLKTFYFLLLPEPKILENEKAIEDIFMMKGRFLVELEELGTQVQKESCQLGSTMSCTALVNDVAEVPTLEALSVCECTTQKPQTYAVQATWAINILWQSRTATHDQTSCPPHAKNWLSGIVC